MSQTPDELRTIVNIHEARYRPYALQGPRQSELTWANLSYDEKTGQGCFLIRFRPGARSIPHEHTGVEEFLILEGDLVDSDGREYGGGDFVSMKPGSRHDSYSRKGMVALVVLRGGTGNRTLEEGEEINIR